MRLYDRMCTRVRPSSRVDDARCKHSSVVAERGGHPRLVEGQPPLDLKPGPVTMSGFVDGEEVKYMYVYYF